MKQILIVIVLTLSICSSGQKLTYKGEWVDTVKITSNSSYYHFDNSGTTTGIYDEYLVVFNKEMVCYILNSYKRISYTITFSPDALIEKEKNFEQGFVVDPLLISNLLKQFEITYCAPNFDNIGLTNEAFLQLADKKHILKTAKFHGANYYFNRAYNTSARNETIFKGCQNSDTLNLFLASDFDTSGYPIITDVSDNFKVFISTEKTDYHFEGKYPNSYKQPWYCYTETSGFSSKSILNFSINNALVDILPDKFSRLSSLKIEALINEYIEWYLKRRGII